MNPSWTKTTPLERCDPAVTVATCRPATPRLDELQFIHEFTAGGPIVRDRLWFFGAGRLQETSASNTLPETNFPYTRTDDNKRAEIKFTGTAASNHTVQGGYVYNKTEQRDRTPLSFTIDSNALITVPIPNWSAFGNYRGILRNDLLVEAQYSERKFKFDGFGGTART